MPRSPSRKAVVIAASVLVVLIIAVAVALSVLDSVLLKKARAQAATYSERLGRPIKIEGISTRILFGESVRILGVEVGPAAGESLPVFSVERVDIKPRLFELIASGGRELSVGSLNIKGLTVNVIRLPDGTTNIERLQERLSKGAGSPSRSNQPEEQGPHPALELDHFRFTEGTVRLIDQTQVREGGKVATAEAKHLDVKADHLRAGEPLEVSIEAAVLADQRNLELKLATAPLPDSLVPTPTRLIMKIQPIDLRPIAPFLPRDVGLQEGKLAADLTADFGAAVSGGKGETKVHGTLRAAALRFAEAEGAKPIDVLLDANLQGDASRGDLQIEHLKFDVGPAGISGKGRVLGLGSGQLRVEGLELVGHDLDPARIAALVPALQRKLKGQIAGPIGLTVQGSGTEASQSIEVRLDFTPVRLAIPETLQKAPGQAMTLVAHLSGAAAQTLRFDLEADLAGVDLRPGESLDKPPGEPLSLSVAGTKSGTGEKSSPLKFRLSEIAARVRDATATGNGSVELSGSGKDKKTSFELSLHSPHIDLDNLLQASRSRPSPHPTHIAVTSKKENPSPSPALFAGLRGHAVVQIDSLRKSKIDLKDVRADLRVADDEVTLQTFSAEAFGGKVSADGTKIHLAQRTASYQLAAQGQNIEVGQALSFAGAAKVLAGSLATTVNLSGSGADTGELLQSASGALDGHLREGQFHGKDLIASVWTPLAKVLPPGLARLKPDAGATSLGKDLAFAFSVERGFAKLKAPLQINLPEGQLTLNGGAHLDGKLDLSGTIALEPSIVSSLTGGKVTPSDPIPIGLKIIGPATAPSVEVADVKLAAESIAKQVATSVIGRLLGTGGASTGASPDKANEEEKAKKQLEEKAKQLLKGLRW
jgi:AsmA protein